MPRPNSWLRLGSVRISCWINEVFWIFISIVCYRLLTQADCMNIAFSRKLKVWIRATWIPTICPYYITRGNIEPDLVTQPRPIQLVRVPFTRKWSLLFDWTICTVKWYIQLNPWFRSFKTLFKIYLCILDKFAWILIGIYHCHCRQEIYIFPAPFSESFFVKPGHSVVNTLSSINSEEK